MTVIDKRQAQIGIVGLGLMGNALAHRLREGGWNLRVWNRNAKRTLEFRELGVKAGLSPGELAGKVDLVITNLSNDQAAREVYLGREGIFEGAKPGLIALEMSTLSPAMSLELHKLAGKLGVSMLDLPIAGSTPAVKAGTLTLLAGGSREIFDSCLPLFEAIAKQWFFMGPAGSGTQMKLVVNLILGVGMEALAESIALGERMGLERENFLNALSKTAVIAPAFLGKFEKIRAGDFSPQFPLKHLDKDLGLALEEAREKGLSLPATEAARRVTNEATKEKGDLDICSMASFEFGAKQEK
jgi:3-hydroxyisobutyrate dehydrogenase